MVFKHVHTHTQWHIICVYACIMCLCTSVWHIISLFLYTTKCGGGDGHVGDMLYSMHTVELYVQAYLSRM